MSVTLPLAHNLATGLEIDLSEILKGLMLQGLKRTAYKKITSYFGKQYSIGILSINNKRITCIKDCTGKIIGKSELQCSLDLAETSEILIDSIKESICVALLNDNIEGETLKQSKLNLVTQSYEFEDTRSKFIFFAKRFFKEVQLLSDWQLTYLSTFQKIQVFH